MPKGAMKATTRAVGGPAKATKTTVKITGKPVNKNEKLRAQKNMKAVGSASAETGKNPYGTNRTGVKKK
jgi:hypothetical protein